MSASPEPTSRPIEAVLIDAAYRIVTQEGVDRLTVRRLAAEAGVSTMMVYTRFGSVGAVAGAVCERGFGVFAEVMESVERTDDPLADLHLQALLYLDFAAQHPRLYTLMFQYTSPEWAAGDRKALLQYGKPTDSPAGRRSFEAMVVMVRRTAAPPPPAPGPGPDTAPAPDAAVLVSAGENWSAAHGLAMLTIAGHLSGARDLVAESMLVTLAVGHGTDRAQAERSLAAAKRRFLRPRP